MKIEKESKLSSIKQWVIDNQKAILIGDLVALGILGGVILVQRNTYHNSRELMKGLQHINNNIIALGVEMGEAGLITKAELV